MTDALHSTTASRVIPIALIDEPELAMRETMSDEGLSSLTASLKALGQLQELVVVQVGDRFRVAAGHRRRLALEAAGFTEARCQVWPEGTPLEEAIKVAENDEREDVNPAAQASYYLWLLQNRCEGDVERLCRLVNRKESHVLDRLDLTRGDADVLDALRAAKISLAVARELNKVKVDSYRKLFLDDAVRQGANAPAVRRWREDLARQLRINQSLEEDAANPTPASGEAAIVSIDACPLCDSADDQHEMEYVRVHRSCRSAMRRQRGVAAHG